MSSARRAPRLPFFALLGLALLARAAVVVRPIENLDGLTIPDDCYYTLNIARSIARGLGPHTGLAQTNGFQPLLAFLEVPSFWVLHDALGPVRFAVALTAVADVAALALFGRMLLRQVGDVRVAWLAMFFWAVWPYSISNATNGLETSLAVFLVLAAASYFPRLAGRGATTREYFLFGVLGGLAMFARVDAGILLAVAAVFSVRSVFAPGARVGVVRGLATAAGVVLTNAPWWLYSFHYTGRIYPDSGRAVRLMSHYPLADRSFSSVYPFELATGVRTIVTHQRATLALFAVALAIIVWRGGRPALRRWVAAVWEQQRLLLVFAGVLFVAYTTYVFGYWFFYRYFYVIGIVVLLVTTLAVDHASALFTRKTPVLAGALAFVVALVVLRREPKGPIDITSGPRTLRAIYLTADPTHRAWMNMGAWADRELPAGTLVGCRSSGAVGYFAERVTVVNLDGVVNHDAYEALASRSWLEYVRGLGLRYLLVWDGAPPFLDPRDSPSSSQVFALERDLPFESLGMAWHVYSVTPPGPANVQDRR